MRHDYIPLKAETEGGELIVEPSEDALYEMITELTTPDNTFVIVEPDEDDPAWFASVSLLDDGTYEVEYRDTVRRRHQLSIGTDPDRIARDAVIWVADTARAHRALSGHQSLADF
ncbi:hypothetical protein GCM10023194_34040 [Planotetraspora phitsanulokensis]|uniref:Uncharacterized protein n=1 Tax=Planotetraspora phitsanulokensis TaxID=575192 RepID=A0A8J3U1Z1_9ACTN|nr:hypothetical protein [Planotetraspora phitsanulokensis]GII36467.1 hypothetical protein Pph01_14700 [Planotetraspora phitsanulokensis]